MKIFIESLSEINFNESLTLRDKLFPNLNKLEQETLKASIDNSKIKILEELGITMIKYWIAKDTESNKVLGIVGLYSEIDDINDVWLGWYGVSENARGLGIGKELLKFAIKEANTINKNKLKLYTTKDIEYKAARDLYEKFGFICKTRKLKTSTINYELDLKSFR